MMKTPRKGNPFHLPPHLLGFLFYLLDPSPHHCPQVKADSLSKTELLGLGRGEERAGCGRGPVIPRWKRGGVPAYMEPKSDPGVGSRAG